MGWDVVVVGAGSSGCALAGRLSEDPGRSVLLLEAGSVPVGAWPEPSRAVASLAGADPDGPYAHGFDTTLLDGPAPRRARIARGRMLGGSSAVNGANHLRATPADADGWGPGWSYADVLDDYVALECDHDVGGPGHGRSGPVPVRRPAGALLAPVTTRFLDAAAALGVPPEPDKNAGGPPGAGPVPANVRDGVRVNAAMAYLLPHRDRANLTVRGDVAITGVVVHRGRAVGVRAGDGTLLEAGEVVLSAGSVQSPHLLALSGIGPADELRAAGIDVLLDRPGVGHGFSDHPSVYVPFADDDPPLHPHAVGTQAAVHLDAAATGAPGTGPGDPAGDVEILLFARPFAPGGARHLMVALQAPRSRGDLTVRSGDPGTPPHLAHHYLADAVDRARLRTGVRLARDLLHTAGLAPPPPAEDDEALDALVADTLTTSSHLCGSARMGPATDPDAVVGPDLRVHGVAGLRVADTSVVGVPRRGPAATALMIGERAARIWTKPTPGP